MSSDHTDMGMRDLEKTMKTYKVRIEMDDNFTTSVAIQATNPDDAVRGVLKTVIEDWEADRPGSLVKLEVIHVKELN